MYTYMLVWVIKRQSQVAIFNTHVRLAGVQLVQLDFLAKPCNFQDTNIF